MRNINKLRNGRISKTALTAFIAAGLVAGGVMGPLGSAFGSDSFAEDGTYIYSELVSGEDSSLYEGIPEEDMEVVEIGSAEEFASFAADCRIDSFSKDKYVKLMADIDLKDYPGITVPIFGGVFDGQGHVISGLKQESKGSAEGLFRFLQRNGEVRNLCVNGVVTDEDEGENTGLIVGENYGKILKCEARGKVSGKENVGGIAGFNASSALISGSVNVCSVTGEHSVGGICGNNEGLVENCENSGFVNTSVSDVEVNVKDITVEDIAKIGKSSSLSAFTDVGGIAGLSSGQLTDCKNGGTIGYEHVGYNIGGIVGRLSQGYVCECKNYGLVLGRKDIGGIAGQMEPFLQVQYMADGISQLNTETNKLFDMIDGAINDLDKYGTETSNLAREISDKLKEVNHISGKLPKPDPEKDFTPDAAKEYAEQLNDQVKETGENMLSLKENFEIIAQYSGKISDLIRRENSTLTGDLKSISTQARKVENIANGMSENIAAYEGITITDGSHEEAEDESKEDSSGEETENASEGDSKESEGDLEDGEIQDADNFGRLVACENYASISADSAVGGIVGRISTEYDFDPEDDVELNGNESLYMNATAKATVRDSNNYGKITSKKDYVGGIAGYVKYGSLISNVSVCDVVSEDGIYAGGIAGCSESELDSCSVCGSVSGKSYVGGIAGKGSRIVKCNAYAGIECFGKGAGEIAGDIADGGQIGENYFVSSDFGGVDKVAFSIGAKPLSYEEFIRLPGLPEEFTDFNIIFIADGKELARIPAKYGEKIDESKIPAIPDKEDRYGVWPLEDLDFVKGNMVLEATYEKWQGSVVSELEVDDKGISRPFMMVAGNFLPGAELELTDDGKEYDFDIIYGPEDLLARKNGLTRHEGPVEVRIAKAGVSENKKDIIKVLVVEDNRFVETESETIGSYISFKMDKSGKFKIVTERDYTLYIVIGIIVFVILSIVIICIIVSRIKKLKKKIESKRPPKAVIFDLDGTLIDTERFYRKVWPEATEHFGYHLTDEQVLELRSLGRPFAPKKFEEWFGEDFNYDVVRTYRKRLFEQCVSAEGIKVKAGVPELLNFLKGKGVTIAVATATDVERSVRYLKAAGIYKYIDKLCSAADVKEGKPSPYVYEEACKQLGLKPWECLAVEDAPNGIKSAAAAGCRVIFVPDQTEDEPEVEPLCVGKVKTADEIIDFFV